MVQDGCLVPAPRKRKGQRSAHLPFKDTPQDCTYYAVFTALWSQFGHVGKMAAREAGKRFLILGSYGSGYRSEGEGNG